MRTRKALKNTITSLIYQLVSIVCGLILPRLILSHFGSSYNGITSSISQFLSCVTLLVAGVGGVTRAALYKPLADNDIENVSGIINATEKFMRRVALIMVSCIVVFALFYPFLVKDEFEWFFSFTLVLILGITTFLQYYFGITYQILLQAEQKQYIISIAQIITTILNTVFAVILLQFNCGIHIIKLGSAVAFALNPLIINIYVRKKYKLNRNTPANNFALSQRWDAFWQAVAYFVHNNTDIIVLTIFTNIKEVSVYTVYNYVISNIRSFVVNFITGFGAAFGNMLAKGEYELAKKNLKAYELIIFNISAVIYTTAGIMIIPFVLIYTEGVLDVSYYRPVFAVLVTIAGAFSCFRIPYQTIVEAVGHYKQTRDGAILEAIINIVLSLLAVVKFGIVGVAVGTLAATIFRSFQYAVYLSKNVIHRSVWIFIGHILINAVIAVITILAVKMLFSFEVDSYLWWMIKAGCVTCVSIVVTVAADLIFYRKDMMYLIKKMKR